MNKEEWKTFIIICLIFVYVVTGFLIAINLR